ncbi:MAG: hypothetical protein WA979_01710 [Pacificimonas sp.]
MTPENQHMSVHRNETRQTSLGDVAVLARENIGLLLILLLISVALGLAASLTLKANYVAEATLTANDPMLGRDPINGGVTFSFGESELPGQDVKPMIRFFEAITSHETAERMLEEAPELAYAVAGRDRSSPLPKSMEVSKLSTSYWQRLFYRQPTAKPIDSFALRDFLNAHTSVSMTEWSLEVRAEHANRELALEILQGQVDEADKIARQQRISLVEEKLRAAEEVLRREQSNQIRSRIADQVAALKLELSTITTIPIYSYSWMDRPHVSSEPEMPPVALIVIVFAAFGVLAGLAWLVLRDAQQRNIEHEDVRDDSGTHMPVSPAMNRNGDGPKA